MKDTKSMTKSTANTVGIDRLIQLPRV